MPQWESLLGTAGLLPSLPSCCGFFLTRVFRPGLGLSGRGGAGWGGAGVAQASSTNIPDSWGGSMPGVSAKHSLYIS